MKVIFLDIDGVLVTGTSETNEEGEFMWKFDPAPVERLNRIIRATDAKIVISSTWRINRDFQALCEYFINQGVIAWPIGKTPQYLTGTRGKEIADYLSSHTGIESFVIIDDDDDMDQLLPYLIQTDIYHGIREEQVDQAIELLRRIE